jgi:hypothetical protein
MLTTLIGSQHNWNENSNTVLSLEFNLNSNRNLKVRFDSKVMTMIRIQLKCLNFGDVTSS